MRIKPGEDKKVRGKACFAAERQEREGNRTKMVESFFFLATFNFDINVITDQCHSPS